MDPQTQPTTINEPQTPESPPSPPQPNSKLPLIIGGLALIILVGGVNYYFGKQSVKTTNTATTAVASPSPTTVNDETANWKIFVSERLGISFKVPPEYSLSKEEWPDPQGFPNTFWLDAQTPNDNQVTDGCKTGPYRGNDLALSIRVSLFDNASFEDFVAQQSGQKGNFNKKIITLGNADRAVTWQWLGEYVYPVSGGNNAKTCPKHRGEGEVVLLEHKNTKVVIHKYPLSETTTQRQKEYKQILSTFKFLDQNEAKNISVPKSVTVTALNHNNPNYSLQYPKPQYCQGCYDGTAGLPDGYSAEQITNQASYYDKPASENWLIEHAVVKQNLPIMGAWSILNENFFNELAKIKINDSGKITRTQDKKSYTFTRLEDKTIDGITANIYIADFTLDRGNKMKYAVFSKGDYYYILAVNWTSANNDYIFDLITSSFQFSLRPNVTPP